MITSIGHGMKGFVEFCERVAADTTGELIKTFRSNQDYNSVVPGRSSKENGETYLARIAYTYPQYLEKGVMQRFIEKTDFGAPLSYDYGKFGKVDPQVFRFVFYLGRIVELIGDYHGLAGMSICEIGPGNGMLFKMITDVYPDVKYTFVDLEAPIFLLKKNVEYWGRESNVKQYLGCQQVMDESYQGEDFDMVLSECAYNECYLEAQMAYMKKILNHSTRGRIYTHDGMFEGPNYNVNPHLKRQEIFELVNKPRKWIYEDPFTGSTVLWAP